VADLAAQLAAATQATRNSVRALYTLRRELDTRVSQQLAVQRQQHAQELKVCSWCNAWPL
jgi:hypothetical protein